MLYGVCLNKESDFAFTGGKITKNMLGLPDSWTTIENWIDDSRDLPATRAETADQAPIVHDEIPMLGNYNSVPGVKFWEKFPSNYPKNLAQTVNRKKLKMFVQKFWFKWSLPERMVAKKALLRLKGKIPVSFLKPLDGISMKNATSAIHNGSRMTDAIAGWIKKGFVAGPFKTAPMKGFRANPLMAAVQKAKVRPIMNLSSPKGASFNDAVDPYQVEKLKMSSPRLFAKTLIKCGKGSTFAKSDIKDAYKLVPNPVEQWRLYGFKWLGKTFFDTTTVFGSKVAPASFDCLAETIVNIVCSEKKVPKMFVHRQLDDVPIVSPKGSKLTENFSAGYAEICEKLNVPLAPECPNHEKAFGPTTFGTVLGINFDSESMEWSISAGKENGLQKHIDQFMEQKSCNLKDVQKLHGKLANFAQSCEFMKGFRYNLLELLKKFEGNEKTRKLIGQNVKDDLWIWKKVISGSKEGLPLGEIFEEPSLQVKRYISDAAGAAFDWSQNGCKNVTKEGDRGVASVGFVKNKPTSVSVLKWPTILLTGAKSKTGKFMGSKSGTLEAVGLLMPFLTEPQNLVGQQVLLEVDNLGVVFGWSKKHCSNDPETSVLLRSLHVLEAKLHCKIYVTHVKRCSNKMAILADNLSRKSTTTEKVIHQLRKLTVKVPQGHLIQWLENPTVNWDLPLLLCSDVDKLVK